MFGIGFFELLVIAVFGLLIFGPEKLPDAIRSFTINMAKAKRAWQSTKTELEAELGMDEIRREIHNAQVQENLEKLRLKNSLSAEAAEEEESEKAETSTKESEQK